MDLLPARYHQVRALERQIMVGFIVLAFVGFLLSTSYIVVNAQIKAYQLRTQSLAAVAGQYKVVNDNYVSISQTEKELQARKALLAPLIKRRASVLGILEGLRQEFPAGIQLASLSVPSSGELVFSGSARNFEDIGRLMRWLADRKAYRNVALVRATAGEAGVAFEVSASQPEGGTGE